MPGVPEHTETIPHRKDVAVMPVSKKQQASVNKYIQGNYDRVNLVLPKGRKTELQAHAAARGESLNGFVNRAIDSQVKQDMAVGAFTVQSEESREGDGKQ